jgi:chromosome segregation ATPase
MATTDMIIPMLTRLQAEMTQLSDGLRSEMATMRREMAMRGEMNARFDTIEDRLERVEHHAAVTNGNLGVIDGRLEQLEHHAVVTNSKLDTLSARVVHFETVSEETWSQVSSPSLRRELTELRTRIEKLESK